MGKLSDKKGNEAVDDDLGVYLCDMFKDSGYFGGFYEVVDMVDVGLFEKNQHKMSDEGTTNCIDILLAIILPPLGVFLKFGCGVSNLSAEFWICLLLTILGYLPGIIYAVYVITK
ncbi:unnamed protein product [Dovyalis caffra]|uniref:Uncharacterized protein n=1 Tax=Dovyalis caffra TaxID=77055 RepID=A0AAV1RXT2_9ROSI|nr:unnamed protein product [Dovyalis caffra]